MIYRKGSELFLLVNVYFVFSFQANLRLKLAYYYLKFFVLPLSPIFVFCSVKLGKGRLHGKGLVTTMISKYLITK